MSKILEAMRRSSQGPLDLNERLRTFDQGNLFPPLTADRVGEFEQLANSLINHNSETTGSVVTFASTTGGEGNSYVSYNCARYLAMMVGRKVAWIDGNFRKPQQKIVDSSINFRELLANPDSLPDFDNTAELVVAGNGTRKMNALDYLKGPEYLRLIENLKRSFYFTIIDAPPILDSVEVAHLARPTLGLVVVVESKRLKYEVVKHGLERMQSLDVKVLGTTLNRRSYHLPDFLYRRL